MAEFSNEEKIDFIFKELKAQKKYRITKIIIKILIIIGLIYLYLGIINSINKDELLKSVSKYIWDLVAPITQNIVDDMIKNTETKTMEIPQNLIDKVMNNNY